MVLFGHRSAESSPVYMRYAPATIVSVTAYFTHAAVELRHRSSTITFYMKVAKTAIGLKHSMVLGSANRSPSSSSATYSAFSRQRRQPATVPNVGIILVCWIAYESQSQ